MKKAFTLAEVLITLAIIGVVAAISIPSVVANTQQKEFQTGLRKAVSVINSAITMNMAIDGESPYENADLYHYLGRHMSIMKSYALTPRAADATDDNAAFYTTDGMRFEFAEEDDVYAAGLSLHENPDIKLRGTYWQMQGQDTSAGTFTHFSGSCNTQRAFNGSSYACSHCGSYGLNSNVDSTTQSPCLLIVDVNGDRKPFPKNASCFAGGCKATNVRKFPDVDGLKLTDTFSIMITDKQAVPYGVAAQRAMYQAQKSTQPAKSE